MTAPAVREPRAGWGWVAGFLLGGAATVFTVVFGLMWVVDRLDTTSTFEGARGMGQAIIALGLTLVLVLSLLIAGGLLFWKNTLRFKQLVRALLLCSAPAVLSWLFGIDWF